MTEQETMEVEQDAVADVLPEEVIDDPTPTAAVGEALGDVAALEDSVPVEEADEMVEDDAEAGEAASPTPTTTAPPIPGVPSMELIAELTAAQQELAEAEHDYNDANGIAKSKKKVMEVAQARLNIAAEAIANSMNPLPAPLLDEIKKVGQASFGDAVAVSDEPSATPQGADTTDENDSWRAERLDSLSGPAIGSRALKAMSDLEPPIVTLGDFVDWNAKKGEFWATDIPGLGDAGRKEVEDALSEFWVRRGSVKKAEATAAKATTCTWEQLVERCDELLTDARYDFAIETVSGIRDWCHEKQFCTQDQVDAIENIAKSVDG